MSYNGPQMVCVEGASRKSDTDYSITYGLYYTSVDGIQRIEVLVSDENAKCGDTVEDPRSVGQPTVCPTRLSEYEL